MIRVEYLSLVSLFLLRKGKEGCLCQHPDAAAVNSSKHQRWAVQGNGECWRGEAGNYVDASNSAVVWACLSTDNRGDWHTDQSSHCPYGEANQNPLLFNTSKDFSGRIRAK